MKVLGAIAAFVLVLMFLPLVGVLLGAFSGWVVGTFWPSTLAIGMNAVGMGAMAPYQFGAFFGFIGGFFKAIQVTRS